MRVPRLLPNDALEQTPSGLYNEPLEAYLIGGHRHNFQRRRNNNCGERARDTSSGEGGASHGLELAAELFRVSTNSAGALQEIWGQNAPPRPSLFPSTSRLRRSRRYIFVYQNCWVADFDPFELLVGAIAMPLYALGTC